MNRHLRRLKHFLVPHKGNKYKPGILTRQSISVIALVLVVIESGYLIDSKVLLKNTGFTAAVLPAALTDLTNTDRTSQGLASLTRDQELDRVAQAKADDMAAKGYFAHISPEGKTPWYWLQQFNYSYTYAGENLAVDFDQSSDVETAWMNSPAHRANILKAQYQYVGYGISQGSYEGHQTTFVVEFFAAKPSAALSALTKPAAPKPPVASVPVAEVPATEIATIQAPSQVLGAESAPSASASGHSASGVFATILSSPRQTVFDIVLSVTLFIGLILTLSLFFHIRKRYLHVELIVGSLILLVLGYAFIAINQSDISTVNLPQDTQSASAVIAL
jgi:Cysteine-rich secretory protein family